MNTDTGCLVMNSWVEAVRAKLGMPSLKAIDSSQSLHFCLNLLYLPLFAFIRLLYATSRAAVWLWYAKIAKIAINTNIKWHTSSISSSKCHATLCLTISVFLLKVACHYVLPFLPKVPLYAITSAVQKWRFRISFFITHNFHNILSHALLDWLFLLRAGNLNSASFDEALDRFEGEIAAAISGLFSVIAATCISLSSFLFTKSVACNFYNSFCKHPSFL